MTRAALPPFSPAEAALKVRMAEDAWNRRDPSTVALAYTPDSRWRNRGTFPTGRSEIEAFVEDIVRWNFQATEGVAAHQGRSWHTRSFGRLKPA